MKTNYRTCSYLAIIASILTLIGMGIFVIQTKLAITSLTITSLAKIPLTPVFGLIFAVICLICACLFKKNIKYTGLFLLIVSLAILISKIIIGIHTSIAITGAVLGMITGIFAWYQENYVKGLCTFGAIIAITELVKNILMLNQNITSLTSLLYFAMIICALIGIVLYNNNPKLTSIFITIVALIIFTRKYFIGYSIGVGFYCSIILLLAGSLGIIDSFNLNKKNYLIIPVLITAIISIVIPAIRYYMFSPIMDFFMLLPLVAGIFYLIVSLISIKKPKAIAILLIITSVIVIILSLTVNKYIYFVTVFLVLTPAIITLEKIKHSDLSEEVDNLKYPEDMDDDEIEQMNDLAELDDRDDDEELEDYVSNEKILYDFDKEEDPESIEYYHYPLDEK